MLVEMQLLTCMTPAIVEDNLKYCSLRYIRMITTQEIRASVTGCDFLRFSKLELRLIQVLFTFVFLSYTEHFPVHINSKDSMKICWVRHSFRLCISSYDDFAVSVSFHIVELLFFAFTNISLECIMSKLKEKV